MDKRLRFISHLRCFESAARFQSYSQAARELSVTQAAVSQQIRNLEQQLGVKLFSRQGRNMLLTQQGQTLAEYVRQAFSTLSSGFDKIMVEPEDGVLTVTASLSFSSVWLVPRLWKFSSQYPNISVRAVASAQLEELRYSDIDVAVRQADEIKADVHQEVLIVDPVYPYCSPNLVEEMDLHSPEKLADCWLVEAIDPGRFSWKTWFDTAGVEMQREWISWIEVTTWEMGLNAVMSGHGVCLASASMASELVNKGLLVRPFDIPIEPGLKFTLLYDKESPKLARINIFAEWLKTELTQGDSSPISVARPTEHNLRP